MSDTFTIPRPPAETELESLIRELFELRQERMVIDEKIKRLLGNLPDHLDLRPTWGPCTRCAHVWKGHYPNMPPRGCPRCGSTGWRLPPLTKKARRPEDPPKPRWGKNRKTGLPTNPENVVSRKSHRLKLEREANARMLAASASSIRIVRESVGGLTPPPKLSEVLRATRVPDSVRFADHSGNIFDESYEAIETDGTILPDDEELSCES